MTRWTLSVVTAAVVLATLTTAAAANFHLTVVADDRRVIDLGTYGFAEGGRLALHVSHLFMNDPRSFVNGRIHNESIGFVLDRVSSSQAARSERSYATTEGVRRRVCFIDDENLKPEIVSKSTGAKLKARYIFPLDNFELSTLEEQKFNVEIQEAGLYALFFYNCKGFNSSTSVRPIAVSFSVVTEEWNVVNGQKVHLPVGERQLPFMYGLFAVVFAVLGVMWLRAMRSDPNHVHRIHHVMLCLVVLKTLTLIFECVKYSHYDKTGEASVWDAFYYVFLCLKGVTLFTVVILLGIGWSVTKPFLAGHDRILLQIMIPCQVVINIIMAVLEESDEGARTWSTWLDVVHILDIFCCCLVLLPIVWTIKNLREVTGQDDKAVRTLSRIRMFRTFYIVVVAFIYFTRIIVVMIAQAMPYHMEWVSRLLEEIAAVAFYLYVGRQFRPMLENPYVYLSQDDREELERRQEVGGVGEAEEHTLTAA